MIKYTPTTGGGTGCARSRGTLWLAGALACGALLAWMDSSPGWDDTGITVGLVLLGSAAFGALRPSWAWAAALAIGGWIPIVEIPGTGNLGVARRGGGRRGGAFGGALARRLLSPQPPAPR